MGRRLLLLACLLATGMAAEVIDRIVGAVGNSVITESQLLRYIRIQALLAGRKPDMSAAAKRTAAEQLVRQLLVHNEMELGHYPLPTMDDINRSLADFREEFYKSNDAWTRALAEYDVSEDDVREAIRLQLTIAKFVSYRFSPSVNVTSDDIAAYYKAHASEMGGRSLDDVRDEIQDIVHEERVNEALDRWLEETRQSTRVDLREDALQ